MNILYHSKSFIVHYSPPGDPGIADENAIQAVIQGEKAVRALTTTATQKIAKGKHDAVQEGLDPTLLTRSETLPDGRTQFFVAPAEVIREIYALTDYLEYVVPYQAAIRAYVNYRFQQTQTKIGDKAAIAVVDIEGKHTFISVLEGDAVEIFRAVKTEELSTEFLRTANFYNHTYPDRELYLLVNSQEASAGLIGAVGGLLGPDIIPEPCPALWALHALDVTPRFILPELEARKELSRQRAREAIMAGICGVAAAITGVIALSSYLTYRSNVARLDTQRESAARIESELKKQIESKFTSWLKSVQPPWQAVVMEIAMLVPEGAKIEKMDISDPGNDTDITASISSYSVSIRIVIEDPNPGAAREAAVAMKRKIAQTRHLKSLEIRLGGSQEGKITLLLSGSIDTKYV